jgi:proline iminopeptidase/L-proline amide hydrolase
LTTLTTSRRTFLQGSLALGTLFPSRALFGRWPAGYPVPDRELIAAVPGGRVYVRVNGRLDGPNLPVVMIHGGPGGTHADFLNLLALSADRAVILYDQLDSGLSDHPNNPKNWTISRFTDELDCVRRALGVRRWHALGHSWGGTIALEYGARRPAELAGLVLASPLISTRSWIADADALRARLPADVRATLKKCEPPAPAASVCEKATYNYYDHYLRRQPQADAMSAYEAVHPALKFNLRIYKAMWGTSDFVVTGTLRDYDGEPKLARLDGRRTLFIDGQYDEARPVTVGAFAAQVPGAAFAVVPNAGHLFYQDSPQEALGILRPWLREQDAIRPTQT